MFIYGYPILEPSVENTLLRYIFQAVDVGDYLLVIVDVGDYLSVSLNLFVYTVSVPHCLNYWRLEFPSLGIIKILGQMVMGLPHAV